MLNVGLKFCLIRRVLHATEACFVIALCRLIARALPTLFSDACEMQSLESCDDTDLSSDLSSYHLNSGIKQDNDSYSMDQCSENISNGIDFYVF